jgi:hypothetical protein
VRGLAVPFEWQEAVIRAAITLKLCSFDDTGAIIAAMTSSIPEAPSTARNWDYRYCWLRDSFFVVHALNRLGATLTMEAYLGWILNVAASSDDGGLQPVYGISGEAALTETDRGALARLSRHGPGAGGQRGFDTGAERRLRRGRAGVCPGIFRHPPRRPRQAQRSWNCSRKSARGHWKFSTSRMLAYGNTGAAHKCTLFPA